MHPLKVCIKLFWRIARMAVLLFHILKHLLAISQQNKIHTVVKNFLVKMNDLLKPIWKDLVLSKYKDCQNHHYSKHRIRSVMG